MTRKLLLFSLLFVLVNISFAKITGLDIDTTAIKDKAAPNQNVEYNVTVTNYGATSKYVVFQTTFIPEQAYINPYNFYIDPGETVYSYLTITIPFDALPTPVTEPYQRVLYVSSAGETDQILVPFWVDIPQEQAIRILSMQAPESVEPRYPVTVKLDIEKGTLDIEMVARFILWKDNRVLEYRDKPFLVREGTHTYNLNFSLNHLTEPGVYPFTVQIRYLNTVVKDRNGTMQISPYYNPELYYTTDTSIFGQTVYVNALNNGTIIVSNLTATKPISFLERYLTYFTSEGAQRSEYSISWFAGNLAPGELKVYEYRVTFVPLLLLPFFIAIVAFLIYIWTRKVVVLKDIISHRMEGGIMEAKVQIKVHNISRTPFFNFKIVEHLPPIVSAVAGIDTLNGQLVVRGGEKKIKWHVDEIRPDEQVIITYKMKTKIEILGTIMIPPTYILFENEKGKTFERKSNIVELQTVTKTIETPE